MSVAEITYATSAPPAGSPEWHALRQRYVGASEVAALFGVHPHLTAFELFHRKAGNLPAADLSGNDAVFWGQTLEPAVADGVAKREGWAIRKVRRHLQHPRVQGMGASLDYEIVAHDRGPGVLEIKTADWFARKRWDDDQPPLHYQLQLQHQLACIGRSWGAIATLVGGNKLEVWTCEAHKGTQSILERAVEEFWRSIEAKVEPSIIPERDAPVVMELYRHSRPGSLLDLRLPRQDEAEMVAELDSACRLYHSAKAAEKAAREQAEQARAEIVRRIGEVEKVLLPGWSISAAERAATEVPAHIRRGYRDFRLTHKGDMP